MTRLTLAFFGGFQVFIDDRSVGEFESDRIRALLAFLAVESDRPHQRDSLAGLLWPDWPDRSARTNLRNALASLRSAIGDREADPSFLLISRETIQFNPASEHWLDVTVLEQALATEDIQALQTAADLYSGPFLQGFSLKDSDSFEDWRLLTGERLQRQAISALRRLAQYYEASGQVEQASQYAWRQVELEPWLEEGHRQLMRLLALSGQRSAALAQYETCRRQLALELGVEPAPETTRLYEQIRDGEIAPPVAVGVTVSPVVDGPPPYRGLQYFGEADADLFFGRSLLTARLVSRLHPNDDGRFLAVVGASGSGKSSIVRAGLIPALQRGQPLADGNSPPPCSTTWPVIVLTPGTHPLEQLALSISRDDQSLAGTAALLDDLAGEPRSLHLHLTRSLPAGADHVLLVVDQFEELFTQCRSQSERQAFVDNLVAAVSAGGPAVVVIALRADFYAHCGEYAGLRDLLESRQVYIGPMNEEELRLAISEPARLGGWTFEPGLVDFLLQEVGNEPGALPLLSHALLETWQHRRGRMMTLAGYSETGGVRGAIARTAERVLQGLAPQGQIIARNIFLRLTELGAATQETRRRASLAELTPRPEQAAAVEQVLKTLVDARLVVTSDDSAEVAHEALIREWPTLREWLEEDAEGLRIQRHLTEAAQEWQRLDSEPGELYHGARLAAAQEWADAHPDQLNLLERDFLAASQARAQQAERQREAQRQRELEAAQMVAEAERQRAVEQARSARRLRSGALILAGVSLVAVLLAFFAFNASATAQREASVNRSLVLAEQAVEADEAGEVDRALALALAAVDIDDPPPDAVRKLASVASEMGTRAVLTGHNGPVTAGAFSPDSQRAISGGCTQPGAAGDCPVGELIVWDLATMAETARWPGHDSAVSALAWSPLGDVILSGGEAGDLILWDAASHAALARLDVHDGPIHAVAFNADGTLAATAGADGVVAVLDVPARQIVRRLAGHSDAVLDVAFSPDDSQILSSSADARMILWDAASGDLLRTFIGHASEVHGVAFVPDGSAILSSGDLSLRLWDVATGQELRKRESGDTPDGLVLSPDGRTVLHLVSHVIYTWDLNQWNAPHRKLFGHVGNIRDIETSDDGRLALTTGDDGTVRIWNLNGADDLLQTNIGFPATGMAIDPTGQRVAIGGWGTCGVLWDLTAAKSTIALGGCKGIVAPGGMAFSPDGRWVAASSGDYDEDTEAASLLVWDAVTGDIHCDLQGHARRTRTVAFSPDGRTALSGSQGTDDAGDLILWNMEDCSLVRRFATEQDTTGIDFSADGRYAFTSSAFSENATLWDVETGQPVRVFPAPGEVFLDAAFGPGDETVLAGAISGVIFEWNRETGEELRRFSGHDGGVWSLEVSPDEQRLVSSDDTGMIILWDAASGAELRRHSAHNALSFQATFSPDSQTVYSVSSDETLVAWQVGDPSLPALRAWIDENRYVRELTCDERAQYGVEPLCKA